MGSYQTAFYGPNDADPSEIKSHSSLDDAHSYAKRRLTPFEGNYQRYSMQDRGQTVHSHAVTDKGGGEMAAVHIEEAPRFAFRK